MEEYNVDVINEIKRRSEKCQEKPFKKIIEVICVSSEEETEWEKYQSISQQAAQDKGEIPSCAYTERQLDNLWNWLNNEEEQNG